MEELIDITEYEFNLLTKLKRNYSYTPTEAEFLQEMADRFLDEKTRICATCTSSINEFKQKLYSWYNAKKEIIETQLDAQKQVNNYTTNNQ